MAVGGLAGLMPAGAGGARGAGNRLGLIAGIAKKGAGAGVLGGAAAAAGAMGAPGFLSNMLTGASVGALGGPMGALVGGAGGLLFSVFEHVATNTKETAEEVKRQRELEEDARRQEASIAASKEIARISFLTEYVRSRGGIDISNESERYLEGIYKSSLRLEADSKGPRTSASR